MAGSDEAMEPGHCGSGLDATVGRGSFGSLLLSTKPRGGGGTRHDQNSRDDDPQASHAAPHKETNRQSIRRVAGYC
jgi:hypothetical protein